jgi:hypothetical protein
MPWAYRGAGAFGSKLEVVVAHRNGAEGDDDARTSDEGRLVARANVPSGLQGGLAVLLLHRLLSSEMMVSTTSLFSFNATKDNEKLEVAVGLTPKNWT